MSPTLVVSEASAIIGAASRAPVIPMATVPMNSLRLDFSPPMSDLLSTCLRMIACFSGDDLIADNDKATAGTPPLQREKMVAQRPRGFRARRTPKTGCADNWARTWRADRCLYGVGRAPSRGAASESGPRREPWVRELPLSPAL